MRNISKTYLLMAIFVFIIVAVISSSFCVFCSSSDWIVWRSYCLSWKNILITGLSFVFHILTSSLLFLLKSADMLSGESNLRRVQSLDHSI
jgi:hypothetical protein